MKREKHDSVSDASRPVVRCRRSIPSNLIGLTIASTVSLLVPTIANANVHVVIGERMNAMKNAGWTVEQAQREFPSLIIESMRDQWHRAFSREYAEMLLSITQGVQTEIPGVDSWQMGHHAHAEGQNSLALGNAAHARGKHAVAVGNGSTAFEDDTLSVGTVDRKRRITHVADGEGNHDAINVGQFARVLNAHGQQTIQRANSYTDQKVGELRKEVQNLDRTLIKGIASSAALHMVTPYAPGRVAVNAGTAVYRGQAAVAAGVSWWHPSGTVNVNGGVSSAGGNSTIVRAGVGYLF